MGKKYKDEEDDDFESEYIGRYELSPSELLDSEFHRLRSIIIVLEKENRELKKAASDQLSEMVRMADQASARTLYMALNGCLPKPGTEEYTAAGYKDETNPG